MKKFEDSKSETAPHRISASKSSSPKITLQRSLGKIVRKKRLELQLSQEELAEKADLHFSYVSSIECGKRNVSLFNIAKIARALNCSIAEMMAELNH